MTKDSKKLYQALESMLPEDERSKERSESLSTEELRAYLEAGEDQETLEILLGDKNAVKELLNLNDPPSIHMNDPDEPMTDQELTSSFEALIARNNQIQTTSKETTLHKKTQPYASLWIRFRVHVAWSVICVIIAWLGFFHNPAPRPRIIDNTLLVRLDSGTVRSSQPLEVEGNKLTLLDIRLPNQHRSYSHYTLLFSRKDKVIERIQLTEIGESLKFEIPPGFFTEKGTYQVEIQAEKDAERFSLGVIQIGAKSTP